MRREDAARLLKECEPELRARGVVGLSLFGSTARDPARPDSDVDVLVELDMSRHPTLVDLSGMRLLMVDHLAAMPTWLFARIYGLAIAPILRQRPSGFF
jgi:predicted nucleotidyltransferase